MRNAKAMILLVVMVGGGVAGCRTAPPAVSADVLNCGKLADKAERYRCYDSLNASMRPASAASVRDADTAAAAAVSAASVHPEAPEASPVVPSGITAPPSMARVTEMAATASEEHVGEEYLPRAARPAAPKKAATVHSSITALNEIRPKIYLITLANGQVWRHAGIETMVFFRIGDDVSVKRALFGSYHLSSPSTGGDTNWVRVTRIE